MFKKCAVKLRCRCHIEMKYPCLPRRIWKCIKTDNWDTVMRRTTVGQIWQVIGEHFNPLVNTLIRAACHAKVCSGAGIQWQCRMRLQLLQTGPYRHQRESISSKICRRNIRPALAARKHLALYKPTYQYCRRSTWKCRALQALHKVLQVVYQARFRRPITSFRRPRLPTSLSIS